MGYWKLIRVLILIHLYSYFTSYSRSPNYIPADVLRLILSLIYIEALVPKPSLKPPSANKPLRTNHCERTITNIPLRNKKNHCDTSCLCRSNQSQRPLLATTPRTTMSPSTTPAARQEPYMPFPRRKEPSDHKTILQKPLRERNLNRIFIDQSHLDIFENRLIHAALLYDQHGPDESEV